jgi:glutathionyl-hydroquinone reductase
MTSGSFVRQQSRFRDRPEGPPERHHLYVALAYPWSQRAVIARSVLGLDDRLGISYLDPYRDERGWAFSGGRFSDDMNGFEFLKQAYDEAYRGVFAALPRLEAILAERRYLTGDSITEADWRLLPTLLRFDAVYHTHFRCNGARIVDFPNLLRYAKDLCEQPGIAATFSLEEVKRHYYTTHDELNPKRIIPAGPADLGFTAGTNAPSRA